MDFFSPGHMRTSCLIKVLARISFCLIRLANLNRVMISNVTKKYSFNHTKQFFDTFWTIEQHFFYKKPIGKLIDQTGIFFVHFRTNPARSSHTCRSNTQWKIMKESIRNCAMQTLSAKSDFSKSRPHSVKNKGVGVITWMIQKKESSVLRSTNLTCEPYEFLIEKILDSIRFCQTSQFIGLWKDPLNSDKFRCPMKSDKESTTNCSRNSWSPYCENWQVPIRCVSECLTWKWWTLFICIALNYQ